MKIRSVVGRVVHAVEHDVERVIDKVKPSKPGTLESVPTDATLKPSGFNTGPAAIARAQAAGTFAPVALNELALDRSATPTAPPTAMQHQQPEGFAWNAEDEHTPDWFPQAITTTSDANAAGTVGGRDWLAVTWHSADGKRSRVSFVDDTDPKSPKYTNVDLVVPDPKQPGRFLPVACHAGGVSWVGNLLYVADTHGGLRVFDTTQLQRVQDPSKLAAGASPVVLPQVGFYQVPKALRSGPDAPVFSGLSLDRATGTLVSQEYRGTEKGGRILRWPVDLATGALKQTGGQVKASAAYAVPLGRVAGVVARGDGFDVATMGDPGGLYHAVPGQRVQQRDTLAQGIQQFSWDAQRQRIWTLDEHPGRRFVWSFRPE